MLEPDQESQCLSALWALAEADGLVSPQERGLFDTFHRVMGGKPAQDLDFERLAQEVPGEVERVELIRLLLMLAIADGKTSALEMKLVLDIARELDVPRERVDEMRHQAYLSSDL